MSKKYPVRPGTNQPTNARPWLWKESSDPRTHYMHRIYIQCIAQANHRKEEWDFEFRDWKDMWDEHFDERGRRADQYTMTRKDPKAAWSKENCMVLKRKEALAHANRANGKYRIQTPIGIFETQKEAAEALGIRVEEIRELRRTNPNEYYYINFKSKVGY